MSQITTHILDTSLGKPASGIPVQLEMHVAGENWQLLGKKITNADGRIPDLLPANQLLSPGIYRLVFVVEDYFKRENRSHFFPFINIVFEINDEAHYHIPLLLNPFGYSTYRGS